MVRMFLIKNDQYEHISNNPEALRMFDGTNVSCDSFTYHPEDHNHRAHIHNFSLKKREVVTMSFLEGSCALVRIKEDRHIVVLEKICAYSYKTVIISGNAYLLNAKFMLGDIREWVDNTLVCRTKTFTNHLSWDEYFMLIALLSAERSKDPNTRVGACIVSQDRIIVGCGYNGFIRDCPDEVFPWEREGKGWLDTKYPYVVHAELNAILNSHGSLKGCTMYTALFPCNECTKAIIQKGISKVIYLSDQYHDDEPWQASRKLFYHANVIVQRTEANRTITLTLIN